MITVEKHIRENYEILEVKGTPTVELLVKEVVNNFRTQTSPRKIWDFTNCPMDQLHVADYNKIIAVVKQYTGTSTHYRTALVLYSEIEQLLGETFETMALAAKVPVEYRIFGTMAQAIAWVVE